MTSRDVKQVRAYAIASLVLLLASVAARSAPSAYAPRVYVRWAEGVSAFERLEVQRRFRLRNGLPREGTTWEYDLSDPSPETVRALISHPAVADTHHIDRETGVVAADAPRGDTLISRNPVRRWRDSRLARWATLVAAASVLVSGCWLVGHRRGGRAEVL